MVEKKVSGAGLRGQVAGETTLCTVGKTGTGVVQILTFGGLGIWSLIDFVIILFGEFKDADGFKIQD